MPIEKTTSSNDATCSSPCSTSFAKLGNWLRNTAPKNHIQLMPSSERNTTRFSCASFRLRKVSVTGLKLTLRFGSVDGADGMNCAMPRPTSARSTQAMATSSRPTCGIATIKPPATLPSRMATKVPISTMPLPPVSSRSPSTCGSSAYFTGPNSVECSPIRKTHSSSAGTLPEMNPQAAISMITISRSFTSRIMVRLSYLSVSCPLVAENSRNGRMKRAPIASPASSVGSQLTCSWYVTITVNANLNRLSLPAPRNWVQKNGPNRRWPSNAN